jgi:hypothetical protein
MGTVASVGTPDHKCYIWQQLVPIEHRRLSSADLIRILHKFLYWDFAFVKAVADVCNGALDQRYGAHIPREDVCVVREVISGLTGTRDANTWLIDTFF